MPSLKEKLLSKTCKHELLTIDGDEYKIIELPRGLRSSTLAECRFELNDRTKMNSDKLELLLLSRCVLDPCDDSPVIEDCDCEQWNALPGCSVTAQLVPVVVRLNGLDGDDTGRAEKKD